jgi:hypothetical protein
VPEVEVVRAVGTDEAPRGLERQAGLPEQHHPAVPAEDPLGLERCAHDRIIPPAARTKQPRRRRSLSSAFSNALRLR